MFINLKKEIKNNKCLGLIYFINQDEKLYYKNIVFDDMGLCFDFNLTLPKKEQALKMYIYDNKYILIKKHAIKNADIEETFTTFKECLDDLLDCYNIPAEKRKKIIDLDVLYAFDECIDLKELRERNIQDEQELTKYIHKKVGHVLGEDWYRSSTFQTIQSIYENHQSAFSWGLDGFDWNLAREHLEWLFLQYIIKFNLNLKGGE